MEVKAFLILCAIFFVLTFDGSDGWRRRRRRRAPPPRVDCAVSGWTPWGSCTKTCDSGQQTRTRSVTRHPQNGGISCPSLTEIKSCNTHPCPCEFTSWSAWSTCSASCDPGQEHRTRSIIKHPSSGGTACPHLQENQPCQIAFCPCEVSGWSAWGDCSQPCDGGTQTHIREITRHPLDGGPDCPELEKSVDCNTEVCSCEVSDWGSWGACDELCGPGKQTRIRAIERPASPGGQECPELDEARYCNDGTCVHCEVTAWTDWNECSKPCDGGNHNRTRTITQQPGPGGRECEELLETERCNADPCPCEVSEWGSWGNCSAACGEGTQERTRVISKEASEGGAECPDLEESRTCKVKECHVHCEVGPWTDFGPCSATCGQGVRERTRPVLVAPQHGGDSCDDLTEEEDCFMDPCPVDCKVSKWTGWWDCKYKGKRYCGSEGTQARKRKILQQPEHGGVQCPDLLRERRNCTSAACPHCQVSEWAPWTHCKAKCDMPGKKYRKRTIVSGHDHGECPNIKESLHCTGACTVESP